MEIEREPNGGDEADRASYAPITDHVAGGLALLTQRWRGLPNVAAVLSSWLEEAQEIEDAVAEVMALTIDTAEDDALDQYGALMGTSNPSLSDAVYRHLLRGAAAAIAAEAGGENFEWASTPEERTRLLAARHKAYFAGMTTHPGCRTVTTDTCVPISSLTEIIEASVAEADASGLPYYIVGHVGDGNFHLAYMVKDGDAKERETAERLSMQMVHRAIALQGTCTGEHGIGLGKIDYLTDELGDAVDVMRSIKTALDPHGLMNPGKIFAGARS